jgi:uncharacterized membrane protein
MAVLRWFDRLRRIIAVVLACAITPFAIARFAAAVQLDWMIVEVLFGVMLATVLWAVLEVVFAIVVAVAETEREAAVREARLPRARLLSTSWFDRMIRRGR